MNPLLRLTYQAMLRLHPADFRAEFGDEMLWIFDQQMQEEACKSGARLSLMLDVVRSTILQNLSKPPTPQYETAGPIYIEIDSTIPAERIAQKWLITLSCTLSLSLFLSMMVPAVAMPLSRLLYNSLQTLTTSPTQTQHLHQFSQSQYRMAPTTHR